MLIPKVRHLLGSDRTEVVDSPGAVANPAACIGVNGTRPVVGVPLIESDDYPVLRAIPSGTGGSAPVERSVGRRVRDIYHRLRDQDYLLSVSAPAFVPAPDLRRDNGHYLARPKILRLVDPAIQRAVIELQ